MQISEVETREQRKLWLVIMAGTLIFSLVALYQIFRPVYDSGRLFLSTKWMVAIGLGLLGVALEAGLLAASWTSLRGRLFQWLEAGLQVLKRLGVINWLLFLAAIAAFSYLVLGPYGPYLENMVTRLFLFWLVVLAGSVFLRAGGLERDWAELLGAALVFAAFGHRIAAFIPDISTYPFTLSWSEASRYYYASLYFAQRIYGVAVPPTVLHPSRYLLQAAPFLIPDAPIWLHRFWQVFLWLGTTLLCAYLFARRFGVSDRLRRWMLVAWAFLFLLIGPVYYHLQIPLILVLWGVEPRRSPLKNLIIVLLASAWAGISRINWFPVPGMLAATLYFLELPVGRGMEGPPNEVGLLPTKEMNDTVVGIPPTKEMNDTAPNEVGRPPTKVMNDTGLPTKEMHNTVPNEVGLLPTKEMNDTAPNEVGLLPWKEGDFVATDTVRRPTLHSLLRYLFKPVVWTMAGTAIAFASQALYVVWSGNEAGHFTSSFSSDLLWYRLLPNPTYPTGILPAVVLVSLPLVILILVGLAGRWRAYHPIRLMGLAAILLVLFAGGLVVSTKIGGGSNLHNLDAFLALIMVITAYVFLGKFTPEDAGQPAGVQAAAQDMAGAPNASYWTVLHKPAIVSTLLVSAYFALILGGPTIYPSRQETDKSMSRLARFVNEASSNGGRVLFLGERQLLTFHDLQGVQLVPDYERVFLMEMAMARNPDYLGKFHDDLKNQRFALIVSEPLFLQYKGREVGFGEENDAWVEQVSKHVLCYYKPVRTLREVRVQLLGPREGVGDCP